ncbi:PD-(D/E)XK nuclease family protein [Candidatus Bipolaricaulota bacterium]|nr:PD-(D/E)XK nuclease family protein [Candidatus Bipolaricaulota bacterium]
MRVEKTLTVDEIYEKVKGFDLVLTAEASLAEAINNRVEEPRVGKLAYTPKDLIRRNFQNEKLNHEKELFQVIVRETDLNWKAASHFLGRALDYWQEVGNLDGFLDSSNQNREKLGTILPILNNTTNIFREMEDYQVPTGKNLCVVGLYQFTGLDRSVLPDSYENLNVFREEKVKLEPFQVYNSASQAVGATIDNISRLGGESTAVVVHPDSAYNPLLRSYLRGKEIEFQVAQKLQDSDSLRTTLELLTLGLRHTRLKLKEVKTVVEKLGAKVPREKEEEYLPKTDFSGAKKFYDFIRETSEATFGEVVEKVNQSGLSVETELEETLKGLGLWSKPVTRGAINDLKYYLDSFTVKTERSDRGVLLVNPGAVAYIDRPVVFYLGMSSRWDMKVDQRPWRNLEEARLRNSNNFKALIQNGDRQLYMVQNSRLNREVAPSAYFNEHKSDLSSFTDGDEGEDYVLRERAGPEGKSFDSMFKSAEPEIVTAISKTGLNELVQCPRDHFFSCLIERPDREYFRKGNVFHEFAEFYANFPALVEETESEKLLDLMVERMVPIVDDGELPKLRTDFQLGLVLLRSYFDNRDIGSEVADKTGYEPSSEDNYFAREFNRELERRFTEMIFLNEKIGARGKVDLLNGDELIDFKTGRKVSASKIVKNSNPELFEESPDFQALLYLAHHRKVIPNEKLKFTFLHLLEEPGSILQGNFEIRNCVESVSYYPWTFEEFLSKDEVFEAAASSKTRKKLLDPLGKDRFLQALSRLDFEQGDFYSRDRAREHRNQFEDICRDYLEIGRGKDLTKKQLKKASKSILTTTLRKLRTRNYFREDVDRFERFLADTLDDLNTWRKTRFPVGDRKLQEVNNRDLILSGEGR